MIEASKKFGRYIVLDAIAQGGMAEIYRARLASVDGGNRFVVIKKIQSHNDSNFEFLKMFKSEIKVSMQLNHPNIVQLYDFGEENEQPFIVMELVEGKSLKQFINRLVEVKKTFPIELATFIIKECASGLHYAHHFKDKITGESIHIVHRDISPQNILISFEGNIKLIDFGIAKASTNIESTRIGIIKGKPSYLSPEQISGETLDGRSDIFALGTVLWETLTGKKLFSGENDLAVLKLIENCQAHVKPPSTYNKEVPSELDAITLKALAKQKEKRFQNAEELQRVLHKFLTHFMPEFNPSDLSYYSKNLFKNEIVEDRKKLQKINQKVEHLLELESIEHHSQKSSQEENLSKPSPPENLIERSDEEKSKREVSEFTIKNFEPHETTKIEFEATPLFSPKSSQTFRKFKKESDFKKSEKSASFSYNGEKIHPEKSHRTKKIDGISNSKKILFFIILCFLGFIGVSHKDSSPYLEFFNVFSKNGSFEAYLNPIQKMQAFQVTHSEKSKLLLKLNLIPGGGNPSILLNGITIDPAHPIFKATLDTPLQLSIVREGYNPFKKEFSLESKKIGELKEWLMDIPLEPHHFGYLSLRSTPSSEAIIPLESTVPWKTKTPIENAKIPIGNYEVRFLNDILNMEKTVRFIIEEGKSVSLDVTLEILK